MINAEKNNMIDLYPECMTVGELMDATGCDTLPILEIYPICEREGKSMPVQWLEKRCVGTLIDKAGHMQVVVWDQSAESWIATTKIEDYFKLFDPLDVCEIDDCAVDAERVYYLSRGDTAFTETDPLAKCPRHTSETQKRSVACLDAIMTKKRHNTAKPFTVPTRRRLSPC